ncbi:MAG: SPOR domain-containing protein [Thermomonas hydrothermalis]|uniref:SPOR domain-containing protein n=1 Tax=Thermomonas hydrothermalis TaxID=213588 RepID=UPI00235673AF|nr:SPOR domain-containing protein [Thermomonas hydrothermalis]MCL6619700.1 SPOR domain-containing protein [Thermomonas hydrothermalis]
MDASLKQRLVGAAVLVALAVIFLPMLVKGPAPDSGVSGVSMKVPPEPRPDDHGMITQELPLIAPETTPAGQRGVSLPEPAASASQAAQPAATAATAETSGPEQGAPLAAVAAGDYAVSFGSYANAADADKVIAVLRAAGLPGYREAVQLGTTPAQRVRIGPFADRASAEAARVRAAQIRRDVQIQVVTLNAEQSPPPAAAIAGQQAGSSQPVATKTEPAKAPSVAAAPAAAASTPAAKTAPGTASAGQQAKPSAPAVTKAEPTKTPPATASAGQQASATQPAASNALPAKTPPAPTGVPDTGFVVQIGAFASATEAQAQRDMLRKAGFNAFTDTVPGPDGKLLTRVRVGPVLTRAEADALKARLKAAGKDGMVRPHP